MRDGDKGGKGEMDGQTAGKYMHREKVGLWVLCFFFFSDLALVVNENASC